MILTSIAFAAALAANASSPLPPPSKPAKYQINNVLEGPQSPYTGRLIQMARSWPPRGVDRLLPAEALVKIRCFETDGRRFFVGAEQFMKVAAPLNQVEAVLDDMDHYKELFPDFKDIHVVSRDENKIVTFWEQSIPIPFVPNVKYEMSYILDKAAADRKVYRYQLKSGKDIRSSDGLIVIEKRGPAETFYSEYDFVDADWGPVETFAPKRIWKDTIEGLYMSDVAVKLKAENPSWDYDKVHDESDDRVKSRKDEIDKCIAEKQKFNL